ncbi:hypothetical protein GCK72_011310 [Caenorhabditis remanei]|uniref:Uncharacterized protein n=1 Tax=Caenorhabditis remanei TaxID=31234 RepID=A0A6A5H7E7_CAERE|nr:hypothetical protein GCK72_011310 [Caenorhabditis remanei]KAF1763045.1 hypothetical protein GCK72_011310 [Caenorhabditis remanei]
MPQIDAIKFSNYTALYLFIYSLFLATYLVSNLLSILFFQYTLEDYKLLGETVLTELLIFGAISLLRVGVRWIHRILKVDQLERWRNEILIGLVGVATCGIVPRVAVHFVEIRAWTIYYSLIVFTTSAILFGITFLCNTDSECQFMYSLRDKTSWTIIIIHTVILAATVYFGIHVSPDWKTSTVIALCHVSFSAMCAVSTVEIGMILRGAFRLRLDEKVVVHKSETVPQMVAPKITMFNYSI